MSEPSSPDSEPDRHRDPFAIEHDIAHATRIQNYLAGGEAHFSADREVVARVADALPGGLDTARAAVRSLGAFVGRSVRYLAREAGIRQFLNVGVAAPSQKNVHQAAQQAAADARFVYVGNDPLILAQAHDLRTSSPEGATAYVHGTLTDPTAILAEASATLDFDQPVAVLLPATLNLVPDEQDPNSLLAKLVGGLAPGSHLSIAHASQDFRAEGMREAAARLADALRDFWAVRPRDEILRFFDGFDLVEPGLVQIDSWQPPGGAPADGEGRAAPNPAPPPDRPTPIYAGIGRKP